ncbi:putative phosphoribosyl transferase [Peptoclostridium acidaminophilum DSM 3953]|uniref:Putative phosphoribosyl transferase n=1 Tax=Peptoclostridium acidaminophilum DSM 3953 TaxID=1286171 RepID=W8T640_PEPAC|nr:dienelactone hydrolase family protein [Peptoclostridium acidaminophilum]AHM57194.1 putative phosphoribosyl transferase [Peptoclostridium acidaminophilum DSM 3953]
MDKKEASVIIPDGNVMLPGILEIPPGAVGIVIFAHGSGSSRFSPRNTYVAQVLRKHGLGTLLMDLMTPQEDRDYDRRFDIALLTRRLLAATKWIKEQENTRGFSIGYFGASTGAAAAVEAAAALGDEIGAVVSRGGRPDMALPYLDRVKSPTLLIVGGHDYTVVELNEKAYEKITAVKELKIVPRAGHLFEERGALESVAELASAWFEKYLVEK